MKEVKFIQMKDGDKEDYDFLIITRLNTQRVQLIGY